MKTSTKTPPNRGVGIRNISDYSPFGVLLTERTVESADFSYGFQGKEGDSEVKGEGNSYDFGARIHDPRIGRWLSLDPLADKYPYASPYTFVLNSPLIFIDPDGQEVIVPGEMRQEAKRLIQSRIDREVEASGSLFKPRISLTDNNMIKFKADDVNKAKRYVKRNLDSRDQSKRDLATIYNLILTESPDVALSVEETTLQDYLNETDLREKKAMRELIQKDWDSEITRVIDEMNPMPKDTDGIVEEEKKVKTPKVVKDKKEDVKPKPEKSKSTGWDLDEKGDVDKKKMNKRKGKKD